MLKLLFRLLTFISLAIAVVMAVLDATRSIAENMIVLTPLAKSWASFAPSALEAFRSWSLEKMPEFVWNVIIQNILQLPGFVVFALLTVVLALPAAGQSTKQPNIGTAH